jgi:hypothetical protein
MGRNKLSNDVRAIYRAYEVEDQHYIEVVELHRYRAIIQRWPLLADIHHKIADVRPISVSNSGDD